MAQYLNELLSCVIKDAKKANIPISDLISKSVCIDYGIETRAGFCEWKIDGSYVIHLSERTIRSSCDKIKDVLAHEIIHTCLCCKNHLFVWEEYANTMNDLFGYNISKYTTWKYLGV